MCAGVRQWLHLHFLSCVFFARYHVKKPIDLRLNNSFKDVQFGYSVYRRVLGYYSNDEDAFGE